MIEKKTSLVQFRVSGQERIMLDQLLSRFGAMSSEYLRSLIREKHSKVFPAYSVSGKAKVLDVIPELTPEQACEQAGGRIETVNGIQVCIFKLSKSMEANVPLSTPELFKKYKKS